MTTPFTEDEDNWLGKKLASVAEADKRQRQASMNNNYLSEEQQANLRAAMASDVAPLNKAGAAVNSLGERVASGINRLGERAASKMRADAINSLGERTASGINRLGGRASDFIQDTYDVFTSPDPDNNTSAYAKELMAKREAGRPIDFSKPFGQMTMTDEEIKAEEEGGREVLAQQEEESKNWAASHTLHNEVATKRKAATERAINHFSNLEKDYMSKKAELDEMEMQLYATPGALAHPRAKETLAVIKMKRQQLEENTTRISDDLGGKFYMELGDDDRLVANALLAKGVRGREMAKYTGDHATITQATNALFAGVPLEERKRLEETIFGPPVIDPLTKAPMVDERGEVIRQGGYAKRTPFETYTFATDPKAFANLVNGELKKREQASLPTGSKYSPGEAAKLRKAFDAQAEAEFQDDWLEKIPEGAKAFRNKLLAEEFSEVSGGASIEELDKAAGRTRALELLDQNSKATYKEDKPEIAKKLAQTKAVPVFVLDPSEGKLVENVGEEGLSGESALYDDEGKPRKGPVTVVVQEGDKTYTLQVPDLKTFREEAASKYYTDRKFRAQKPPGILGKALEVVTWGGLFADEEDGLSQEAAPGAVQAGMKEASLPSKEKEMAKRPKFQL
jgi:hypothetical protein